MGKTRKEFEKAAEMLSMARDEDEVVERMTYIVKGFSSAMYREMVWKNPYYRDLFQEIRESVMEDLDNLEKALRDEIYSIEENLKGKGSEISEKLKDLRRDCEMLIEEIGAKREEMKSI